MISDSGKVNCLLKSEVGKDLKFHKKCLDKYSHSRKTLTKMLRDLSNKQEKDEKSEKKARLSAPRLKNFILSKKLFRYVI